MPAAVQELSAALSLHLPLRRQWLADLGGRGASAGMTMCTTMGHEDVPAVAEARVEDDPKWYPFCLECIALSDPPIRWSGGKAMQLALLRFQSRFAPELIRVVEESLLANDKMLRDLHHVHAALDANARRFIAEIVVLAILNRQEVLPA